RGGRFGERGHARLPGECVWAYGKRLSVRPIGVSVERVIRMGDNAQIDCAPDGSIRVGLEGKQLRWVADQVVLSNCVLHGLQGVTRLFRRERVQELAFEKGHRYAE